MESGKRVGFAGLGIMGWPMAANLARAGYDLAVWTHTSGKAQRFADEFGATAAATPAEAAAGADAFVTMVVDGPEVETVLLGRDGAAAALGDGGLAIDMSTIAPTAVRSISERLAEHGVSLVDAPVTGSRPRAEDGTLTIMAGAADADFERAKPLFEAMGKLIVHVGPSGHGAMAKVIANTVTAINAAAVAEALTVVRAAGLDPDAFLQVARAGSSGSMMMEIKAQPMLDGDFEPLFKLEHMLKDIRHCVAEARALGIELQLATLAERMYAAGVDAGHGDEDIAAIVTVAEAAAKG